MRSWLPHFLVLVAAHQASSLQCYSCGLISQTVFEKCPENDDPKLMKTVPCEPKEVCLRERIMRTKEGLWMSYGCSKADYPCSSLPGSTDKVIYCDKCTTDLCNRIDPGPSDKPSITAQLNTTAAADAHAAKPSCATGISRSSIVAVLSLMNVFCRTKSAACLE